MRAWPAGRLNISITASERGLQNAGSMRLGGVARAVAKDRSRKWYYSDDHWRDQECRVTVSDVWTWIRAIAHQQQLTQEAGVITPKSGSMKT